MDLKISCSALFGQLEDLLHQLDDNAFTMPVVALSNATIGQHTRHLLEFFDCLHRGALQGKVDYDARSHDRKVETDRVLALSLLERLAAFIPTLNPATELILETSYGGPDSVIKTQTNVARELIYTIEHAIHHMALIKVALIAGNIPCRIPESFGVASSTLRYREKNYAAQ